MRQAEGGALLEERLEFGLVLGGLHTNAPLQSRSCASPPHPSTPPPHLTTSSTIHLSSRLLQRRATIAHVSSQHMSKPTYLDTCTSIMSTYVHRTSIKPTYVLVYQANICPCMSTSIKPTYVLVISSLTPGSRAADCSTFQPAPVLSHQHRKPSTRAAHVSARRDLARVPCVRVYSKREGWGEQTWAASEMRSMTRSASLTTSNCSPSVPSASEKPTS